MYILCLNKSDTILKIVFKYQNFSKLVLGTWYGILQNIPVGILSGGVREWMFKGELNTYEHSVDAEI